MNNVYLDKEGDICLREFEATECIPRMMTPVQRN
jgi:hypothetical protein